MNKQEQQEFTKILGETYSLYGKELQPGVLQIYLHGLDKYSIGELAQALSRCVLDTDTGQFVPKPADIIRQLEGDNQTAAALAWTKAYSAIGRVGPYRDIVFDDALIHRVIEDMGGWVKLCSIDDDQAPFVENDFIRRYQGYHNRKITPKYLHSLQGIASTENQGDGYMMQNPVLFGDKDLAMIVFNGGSETPLLAIVEKP